MRRAVLALLVLVALFAVVGEGSAVDSRTSLSECPAADICATVTVPVAPPPAATGLHSGSGTVTSSPPGIDCQVTEPSSTQFLGNTETGTCTSTFVWPVSELTYTNGTNGADVDLTATPSTGSTVCGEQGGVSVSMCTAGSYTATPYVDRPWWPFSQPASSPYRPQVSFALALETVTVTRSGNGTGSISSSPAGVACGTQCSKQFDYGSPVTLTAVPDAGATFSQWTGACAGQGAACQLTTTGPVATNAVFGLAGQTATTTTPSTTTSKTTTTTTTNKTTTTAGTTTTTSPATTAPPPATTTGHASTSHSVQAQLIGVRTGKSLLGFREETVELRTAETVTAVLALVRRGKRLTSASIRGIRPGDRVVVLPVPASVGKGKATLVVALTDASGAHLRFMRAVVVPN
jgi:hypothetical protein